MFLLFQGGVFRIHVRLHPKFRPSSVTVTSLAQKFKPPTRKGLFMNLGNSLKCAAIHRSFSIRKGLCATHSFNNMYHVDSRLSIHDKVMDWNPRVFSSLESRP